MHFGFRSCVRMRRAIAISKGICTKYEIKGDDINDINEKRIDENNRDDINQEFLESGLTKETAYQYIIIQMY